MKTLHNKIICIGKPNANLILTSKQKTKVVVTPPPTSKGRPKGSKNKQPSSTNKQSPPKTKQPPPVMAKNKQPPAKRRKLNDDNNATSASRSPSSCNIQHTTEKNASSSDQINLSEEFTAPETEPEKRKAGRPKGKTHINSAAATMKPPGDPTYPLVAYSLTVTKNNGDISDQLLPIIQEFVEKYCERGNKSNNNYIIHVLIIHIIIITAQVSFPQRLAREYLDYTYKD